MRDLFFLFGGGGVFLECIRTKWAFPCCSLGSLLSLFQQSRSLPCCHFCQDVGKGLELRGVAAVTKTAVNAVKLHTGLLTPRIP